MVTTEEFPLVAVSKRFGSCAIALTKDAPPQRCQATLHIRNYALSLKAMMLKRSVAVAFAGALYISRMRVKIDDDFVVHFASRSALYNLACCRYNAT
jgi:hypothetical protein